MAFSSYRERSRENWGTPYSSDEKPALTIEQINSGCLLRIADATEAMAANYVRLQSEVDYLKRRRDQLERDNNRLCRQVSSLRGVITRLKKKLQSGS